MSKKYFKNFPKVDYTINGITYNTVDLTVRHKIIEDLMQNPNVYYEYSWSDADRVDIVANKYYGDPEFAWVVMLSADVYDWLHDLPLNENNFEKYLQAKYDVNSQSTLLHDTIHHYEDITGTYIDYDTYNMMEDYNKKAVSVYEHEFRMNEQKRTIKLLSKSYIKQIMNEFEDRLTLINNNRRLFKN